MATTGSDSNAGTQAQPWRTIQKAANALAAGQRALVRGGTYTENVYVARSGNAAPITIEAYPGEKPILTAAGSHPSIASSGAYFPSEGS